MAWNTQRLQRAVERESQRTTPRYSVEALRGIGPVGHRHINLRGTYRFPVERYAERLSLSGLRMICIASQQRKRQFLQERYATPHFRLDSVSP
jgi:hypothetical protein